jgi:hypothetical protein
VKVPDLVTRAASYNISLNYICQMKCYSVRRLCEGKYLIHLRFCKAISFSLTLECAIRKNQETCLQLDSNCSVMLMMVIYWMKAKLL